MKTFYVSILLISIWAGWLCSQASNCVVSFDNEYTKQTSKIDRLISIFEDWKEKDTRGIR